jgi:hypothetical protein
MINFNRFFFVVVVEIKVTDRRCTDERWVYELLYDGCLTYANQYWCICSSSFCNGGNVTSIRGKDDCSANPCPTGAMCLDTYEGFKCMCPPWQPSCTYYQPTNCPCKNGGLCVQLPNGNLGCSCKYGYTGDKCDTSKSLFLSFFLFFVKYQTIKQKRKDCT